MNKRPVIGVLLDYEEAGSFSRRPHYALRTAYCEAVWQAGGLPVTVPYVAEAMDDYLNHIDGLVTPGGSYAFPDSWYAEGEISPFKAGARFDFEAELTRRAMSRDMPLLGICAGMQVMAGIFGATFYRDIRHQIETSVDHLDEKPAEETAHDIIITEGTLLHRLTGKTQMAVNTAHQESLCNVPSEVTVNAIAPDGVIEGIEFPTHRFALGVQWHPEFFLAQTGENMAVLKGLVQAAATNQ